MNNNKDCLNILCGGHTQGRVTKVKPSICKNAACTVTHFFREGAAWEWVSAMDLRLSGCIWRERSSYNCTSAAFCQEEVAYCLRSTSLSPAARWCSIQLSCRTHQVRSLYSDWILIHKPIRCRRDTDSRAATGGEVQSDVWQRKTKQWTRDILLMLGEVAASWLFCMLTQCPHHIVKQLVSLLIANQ